MPGGYAAIGVKVVNALIVVFWLFLLTDSYNQGRDLPGLLADFELPTLPVFLSTCAILLFSIGCAAITYRQRVHIMEDMPLVTDSVDRCFGHGAYGRFTSKLRPVLASVICSFVLSAAGFYSTYETTRDVWSFMICFGFLSFAGCMLAAYVLSRKFPPALS
jgi:hypothetical protein